MFSRRHFLNQLTLASGAAAVSRLSAEAQAQKPSWEICAFVKFVQDLSYAELAKTVAQLGYAGIEATIRKRGQIEPESVEGELPKLVAALDEEDLAITIMASDVNRADDPLMEKTLRVAASLGVKRYRMSYYRYDLDRPIRPQLDNFRPMAKELAALNRELGLQAVYQNHAGARYVGASLWDLDLLLEDIDPAQIAIGFDVRHATVEGGTTWSTLWKLIQPRLGAVYVKDFVWKGLKVENVPLGQGRVDPTFFTSLARKRPDVPFAVHVEYLGKRSTAENVEALRVDLIKLRELLGIAP